MPDARPAEFALRLQANIALARKNHRKAEATSSLRASPESLSGLVSS
jgi:hypothetical protein